MFFHRRFAIVAALTFAPSLAFAQQTPSIVVDGAPVTFDQPPVERAGRIYVPLRGVFERLGASVVFAAGQINATAGSHTIGLHLGSTTATVDGTTQNLDSPPFLIGARTLVPLRFLSQALGASVNFDGQSQTVYVVRSATPAPVVVAPPKPPPPPDRIAMRMLRVEPANDSTIDRKRPEISATFSETIDPNTIRLAIDGRDVTPESYVSKRSFVYTPNFDLPAGAHEVLVTGKTPDRESFRERWAFSSTDSDKSNYISGLEPPNGTQVASAFTVSAFTSPMARVRIVITTSETIPNFSDVTGGTSTTDAVADGHGYFEARIELPDHAGGIVDVRITSTATDGTLAVKTLRLRQ
ncbi:MAG: copper amine oxidase N-terminal domain-containing protein [Candidatus Eremiobacteraeota bacterium]|nr:copper amine oxidase N-terminal domain-containing protein [Candidatus Eremiobacteraeota bacterium]